MTLPKIRIGQGFDVHIFGEGHQIMLGGVSVPHTHGLIAHSDGDVVIHALCDAIFGALAMGDIGRHFPPSDPQWKNAASRIFLEYCQKLLETHQWQIGNADITVICEKPKLSPHIESIRLVLSQLLKTAVENISVKATTTEQLGFTGRGEGIAAQAVVLLVAAE